MTATNRTGRRCLRCRRKLRAAASIAASYGPVCRARIRAAALAAALAEFTAAQVDKARELLADGGSLAEIGQVLRHRRAVTTAAYTKVRIEALRALARPWPGASS